MSPRLLLINCASPYFFYIPMGSFGLCDALRREGMEAWIFNPALYPDAEVHQRLLAVLAERQPTHVGFACHWQETIHGLLAALAMVHAWSGEVVTLAGGFTASYFAEDLLREVPELEYVVVGDPERPVIDLLAGRPVDTIANLVRRERGAVRRNAATWLIEQAELDRLAFGDGSLVIDGQRYFEAISARLGFPLFIGRGCVFDCAYCGGSRHAFRLHSGRTGPVTRSLAAILADLRRLREWTSVLYLCYENDPGFVKNLFRAIGAAPELRGRFTLHYGAWHLLDDEFLDLYQQAFDCTSVAPIFEFSPEVADDRLRAAIKRGSVYSLAALEENIAAITALFAGRVRIEVFFSRYHPPLTAADLERETGAILRFRHRLVRNQLPVHVCCDHLSTDIASRNWEDHQERPRDLARFLRLKTEVDQGCRYPFPVDNLCLHIPDHLPEPFVIHHEALLLTLERLEQACHELVQVLMASLEERWLEELSAVLAPRLREAEARAVLFRNPPLAELIEDLGRRLRAGSTPCPAFLSDLIRFSLDKLAHCVRPAESFPGPIGEADCLLLDRERVGTYEQDYLDLPALLHRLDEREGRALPYRRTVCLFLAGGIVSLPHGYYRSTLRFFEEPRTLAAYRDAISGQAQIDWQQHESLVHRLFGEGLLRTVPCAEKD